MSKNFLHLRHWITGETYSPTCPPRPVILECIPSRSGMSMGVYDRGERIFTVNGCGFDRIGTALGEFLEACFQAELSELARQERPGGAIDSNWSYGANLKALQWNRDFRVSLQGASGFESMAKVAAAIGLEVTRSESKAGTLILITKKGN